MVLSPLGGSGKTYRLANNLTIDYHDFGELETLWTNQVVSDKEVMQIIAASAETMELHAQTPFVMDAVSTSSTAMDAVSTSSPAMDAVSTSATAMDAVSTSQTAMDAVASAVMPRTKVLSGGHRDILFSVDTGSYWFFNHSAINPSSGTVEGLPYTYQASGSTSAGYTVRLMRDVPSSFNGGYSIWVNGNNDYEDNDQAWAEIELDLSGANDLDLWVQDIGNSAVEGNRAIVLIDGSKVADYGTTFSWTQETIDVSSYSGTHKLGLGANFTGFGETFFTGFNLR